jgi:hypothetical protein
MLRSWQLSTIILPTCLSQVNAAHSSGSVDKTKMFISYASTAGHRTRSGSSGCSVGRPLGADLGGVAEYVVPIGTRTALHRGNEIIESRLADVWPDSAVTGFTHRALHEEVRGVCSDRRGRLLAHRRIGVRA